MGLGMDRVVRENEGWCVSMCGWRWGGYFADVLSYWLVQTLGEGQPQTILLPAVGKSRETKRERGEREEGGGPDMCFNVDILV